MGFIIHKLPNIRKPNLCRKYVLPGIEIGIPLTIFQEIFTNIHYGYSITNIKNIAFQFTSGFFTYGSDRLLDSFDNLDNPSDRDIVFQKNQEVIFISLILAYYILTRELLDNPNTIICIPILTSTLFYKKFKQHFGEYKAIFISSMWSLSTIIIPCVFYEDNWNILLSPIDYIPPTLTLFATSNIADIQDIKSDSEKNIQTIPVKYGKTKAYMYSMAALAISSFCLIFHPNFDLKYNYISAFELQNAAISLMSLPHIFNYTTHF